MKKALFNPCFSPQVISFTSDQSLDFSLKSNYQDQALNSKQVEFVQQNYHIPQMQYINIRQVHGNGIVCVGQDYMSNNVGIEEADGLLTTVPQHALLLRTADCLPVFLFDVFAHCIGIIHAGWRGTQKNIMSQAIKVMSQNYHCEVKNIKVNFGPCIRSCCYRVGKEFLDIFSSQVVTHDGEYYFDLAACNKQQLIHSGVLEDNIYDSAICTHCDINYFSYRRDGEKSGRMLSLIALK